jgi:hypothetical protein
MSECITIAAFAEGSLELEDRRGDVWPVSRSDLDAEIERIAALRGWNVLVVEEPPHERGPLLVTHTDPETGEQFQTYVWQLYAYVCGEHELLVEPREVQYPHPDSIPKLPQSIWNVDR